MFCVRQVLQEGRHYQFRVLPFGLSLSLRVFTMYVAAAPSPLGLRILPCLDDWLICAPTRKQSLRDTCDQFLPEKYHVVCLDLPGHDGTSRLQDEDYSINGQVSRIHQFVHRLGLQSFHLMGTSMGGNLAGVYAARFPKDLISVTLVCPAGLESPEDTEFVKRLKVLEVQKNQNQDQRPKQDQDEDQDQRPKQEQSEESIALIPSSVPQLQEMLNLCCYKPLQLPQQMMKGLLQNRLPHNNFYKHLFECISSQDSRHSLQQNLQNITVPVQVVWGEQDQVLHVSGASLIPAALPHTQVVLLQDCGHSLALERPRKLAMLVHNFLSAQEGKDSSKKNL
uniref:AB hydrolase-1 domain-containing protein n=1 Tax=Knipowitschia caucasica TaxID=637954 RepID=A0AAV2MIW6_KNICA